jgi:hypothetical protein
VPGNSWVVQHDGPGEAGATLHGGVLWHKCPTHMPAVPSAAGPVGCIAVKVCWRGLIGAELSSCSKAFCYRPRCGLQGTFKALQCWRFDELAAVLVTHLCITLWHMSCSGPLNRAELSSGCCDWSSSQPRASDTTYWLLQAVLNVLRCASFAAVCHPAMIECSCLVVLAGISACSPHLAQWALPL